MTFLLDRQLPITLTPLSEEPGFSDEFLASNSYYHSKRKGCSVQNVRSSYNRILRLYTKQKCLTHKVVIGRAGWTLGHYGGSVSMNYK